MTFRDYKYCIARCIVRDNADELESSINQLQERYNIIDLQYSTHSFNGEERYSVLVIVTPK